MIPPAILEVILMTLSTRTAGILKGSILQYTQVMQEIIIPTTAPIFAFSIMLQSFRI